MRKKLMLLAASLPLMYSAQTTGVTTFSSGAEKTEKFTNSSRLFRDWSVTLAGGVPFMHNSDLTSFYDGKANWGWNGFASINKQITHAFGVSLFYQQGKTKQQAFLTPAAGVANAWTKYKSFGVLGDINFTNLLRRVDNQSPYRWALHGYAGIGLLAYNTELVDNDENRWSSTPRRVPLIVEQEINIGSLSYDIGLGLKYNVSKLIDLELRAMYLISGDDEFDGSGWADPQDYNPIRTTYTKINDSRSDNVLTVNLGVSFKIGKKDTHLSWHDPIENAYTRANALERKIGDFQVCESGDKDNDGVCDDWDRELNTPAGARVDGAGVALDLDLDGVIDLHDKCVTEAGPASNNGCPTTK